MTNQATSLLDVEARRLTHENEAALISAAPDLLEVAKYYYECRPVAMTESEKIMEAKARAAIALAEGGEEAEYDNCPMLGPQPLGV